MHKPFLYKFTIFVVFSVATLSMARASIVVYTDRTAWEAAALALYGPGYLFPVDFESLSPGGLSTGRNSYYGEGIEIYISGAPGINAIDDSSTPDPFDGAMSPNGSTYYLGETNAESSPSVGFLPFVGPLITTVAFGADWVVAGDLVMDVGFDSISITDYLTAGSGFFGVIEDTGRNIDGLTLLGPGGTAFFGMDEIRYVPTPLPPAVWFFGLGLLGLIGTGMHRYVP